VTHELASRWRAAVQSVLPMAVELRHELHAAPSLGGQEAPTARTVVDWMGVGDGSVVADVGAGGGWFTVRLARRVGPNGKVYAEDIQPEMLAAIRRRVLREGFSNVLYVQGKTADPSDPGLPADALDAVLIVDAYHEIANPVNLLQHLGASLKPAGRIGIVGFTLEGGGPGPALNQRVDAQKVIDEAAQAGLRLVSRETFLDFQYLLILGR